MAAPIAGFCSSAAKPVATNAGPRVYVRWVGSRMTNPQSLRTASVACADAMFIPRCSTSSLMVKPRDGCAVRNDRIPAARVAAGAARAMGSDQPQRDAHRVATADLALHQREGLLELLQSEGLAEQRRGRDIAFVDQRDRALGVESRAWVQRNSACWDPVAVEAFERLVLHSRDDDVPALLHEIHREIDCDRVAGR